MEFRTGKKRGHASVYDQIFTLYPDNDPDILGIR